MVCVCVCVCACTLAAIHICTQLEPAWLLHMYVHTYVCMYVGGCCYIMRLKSIMESMQPLHLPSVELQDNQKITKGPLGENTILCHKGKGSKHLEEANSTITETVSAISGP